MYSRLKQVRLQLKLSQKEFGNHLFLSQDQISLLERGKRNLIDRTLNDICRTFNVNEEWLLYGTGSIFVESDTFSLDAFCEQRKATDLEKEIIKAYLDLDPDIRKKVLDHFKSRLCRFAEDAPSNVTIFRAARSDNDTPPGEVEMSASDLKKLKTATPITSDDDI